MTDLRVPLADLTGSDIAYDVHVRIIPLLGRGETEIARRRANGD